MDQKDSEERVLYSRGESTPGPFSIEGMIITRADQNFGNFEGRVLLFDGMMDQYWVRWKTMYNEKRGFEIISCNRDRFSSNEEQNRETPNYIYNGLIDFLLMGSKIRPMIKYSDII